MRTYEVEVVNALGQTYRVKIEANSKADVRSAAELAGYQIVAIVEQK